MEKLCVSERNYLTFKVPFFDFFWGGTGDRTQGLVRAR